MKLAALSLALMPFYCGPVPPAERALAPGRYAWEATWLAPGATDSSTVRGALVLEASHPDSLVGRWEGPGVAPTIEENRFDVVGYRAVARLGDSLTLVHSIGPRRGRTPRCHVSAASPGRFEEGRCTLTGPSR